MNISTIKDREFLKQLDLNNNKVSYTELLKDVIQEKLNKTTEIKETTENKKINDRKVM